MEFSRLVDSSLDLNLNLSWLPDDGRNAPHLAPELKKQGNALTEELNRLAEENKKLTELLAAMSASYSDLKSQLLLGKRKAGSNGPCESESSDKDSAKRAREDPILTSTISQIFIKTDASDTSLIVKDGYKWRKYGQKVTRDNPCPRAYFRCASAPSCLVKKKVQRSVEDQTVVVATYEGEHNHSRPSKTASRNSGLSAPCSSCEPVTTPDITKEKIENQEELARLDSTELQQFLVEKMASILTNDPDFTTAVGAAISGKFPVEG